MKVKDIIKSNGFSAIISFTSENMTSRDYYFLSREIERFYKTFWKQEADNWTSVIPTRQEENKYISDFFRGCNFIIADPNFKRDD